MYRIFILFNGGLVKHFANRGQPARPDPASVSSYDQGPERLGRRRGPPSRLLSERRRPGADSCDIGDVAASATGCCRRHRHAAGLARCLPPPFSPALGAVRVRNDAALLPTVVIPPRADSCDAILTLVVATFDVRTVASSPPVYGSLRHRTLLVSGDTAD